MGTNTRSIECKGCGQRGEIVVGENAFGVATNPLRTSAHFFIHGEEGKSIERKLGCRRCQQVYRFKVDIIS